MRAESATTVACDQAPPSLLSHQGGNYTIKGPGRFRVEDGALSPINGRPVMVVSDLDGTMVGDDGATKAFRDFWLNKGAVRGGVLVYNTGR